MADKTPDYYDKPGMETIEKQVSLFNLLISLGIQPTQAFYAATAVKYIDRMGEKGDEEDALKDRDKAANYLYRFAYGCWPWER